jgi:hypothetical protein
MENTILHRRIPLPKKKTRSKSTNKVTETICTLNNISSWIRFSKTKIKNDYKNLLQDLFIPEPDKEYKSIVIEYRILRDSNRQIDKDNVVFSLKWLSDLLEELGYIKNDNVVNFRSFDTKHDLTLDETMLEIRIVDKDEKW